jgi:hypothetical protein
MPVRAQSEQRALRVALLLAWLLGSAAMVAGGFVHDGYLEHVVGIAGPQPYPSRGVLTFLVIVSTEMLMLRAICRPATYAASWGRALLATAVFACATAYFVMWLMRAPPYQVFHALWSLAVAIALLVLTCSSAIRAYARRKQSSKP